MAQQLIVALIVAGAFGYAAWTLMPARWRQALLRRAGRRAEPPSACGGCGGCGGDSPAEKPIRIHR